MFTIDEEMEEEEEEISPRRSRVVAAKIFAHGDRRNNIPFHLSIILVRR